jgi:hypothetical protein
MESTEDACDESQEEKPSIQDERRQDDRNQERRVTGKRIEDMRPFVQSPKDLKEKGNKFPFLVLNDHSIEAHEYVDAKLIHLSEDDCTDNTPEDGETDSIANDQTNSTANEDTKELNDISVTFWLDTGTSIFNNFNLKYLQKSPYHENTEPFESFKIIGCKRGEHHLDMNIQDSAERLNNPKNYSKFGVLYVQDGINAVYERQYNMSNVLGRPDLVKTLNETEINKQISSNNGVIFNHPIYINSSIKKTVHNSFTLVSDQPIEEYFHDEQEPTIFWLGSPNEELRRMSYDCYIFIIKLNKHLSYSDFQFKVHCVTLGKEYKAVSYL